MRRRTVVVNLPLVRDAAGLRSGRAESREHDVRGGRDGGQGGCPLGRVGLNVCGQAGSLGLGGAARDGVDRLEGVEAERRGQDEAADEAGAADYYCSGHS